jgi:uncharacterized protein (TIGR03118 family)
MNRSRLVCAGAVVAVFLSGSTPCSANTFTQTNLVSDIPGEAAVTDPNLINPWGVSFVGPSPFWVSDQGSGKSTLYDGAGTPAKLVVTIPGGSPPSGPTGQVFNGTTGFGLPNGSPAVFIFDTLNGTIDGWNGAAGTTAVQTASTKGAIFTGLALASSGASNYLYAADSTGQIRVFDSSYKPITLKGNFSDPNAVAGFTPFNIESIGSNLYVTYAGRSGGYIDVFNTDGTFVRRLTSGGPLDAPWGMAIAPAGFGNLGNDLLVGNFGNGEILAYNASTGQYITTLDGADGKPIVNDFLWSLEFRTAGANVNTEALYFTAGINNQKDGLFGEIASTPEPASVALLLVGLGTAALIRRRFKPVG